MNRDRRDAEIAREASDVDLQPFAFGLVHQIDRHHHALGDLEHLQDEIEVSLERGRVDDDHCGVGPAEEQEIARDFFVVRRREE